MARKPTKKEAKQKLSQVPDLPGFLTRLPGAPGLAARVLGAAKPLAELLIDVDPLNRTAEPTPTPQTIQKEVKPVERNEVVKRMVNDPGIKIDEPMRQAINDDNIMMADTGELMMRITPVNNQVITPGQRTRKKTKTDRVMSSCLKEANRRLRTKSGKLRKGKTQADVMRLAHRLCKKEMK